MQSYVFPRKGARGTEYFCAACLVLRMRKLMDRKHGGRPRLADRASVPLHKLAAHRLTQLYALQHDARTRYTIGVYAG